LKFSRRIFESQNGTVAILLTVAMVVLVGFTALVTDAGLLFLHQGRLENGLDSAVLAGAQDLPADPEGAVAAARQYAEMNGIDSGEIELEVSPDQCSIRGNGGREVGMIFARVLGMNRARIHAVSSARVDPASAVTGVVPFGVLDYEYSFGDTVVLKEGAGENFYAGWFGALSLGGTGASVYLNNVKNGYDGEIRIGDVIQIEAGNMSGPTKEGIEYRINQCHHSPACSIAEFQDGCSRILIIPIVTIDSIDNGGHVFSVRVVGFGAFLADQYVGHGNDNEVQGAFIRYVVPGTGGASADDYGLYAVRLCE